MTDHTVQARLNRHVRDLMQCRQCPSMLKPVVSGGAVVSKIMLVGQAPGDKEPRLGRPFAWTAGRTLFKWWEQSLGWNETQVRERVYFAAVCRCFPGKKPGGGDRVPDEQEIQNCSGWLRREIQILRPQLVIPVGKLAIGRFLQVERLDACIGHSFPLVWDGLRFDVIPLPHPSGASPWHRMEPGKTLLTRALSAIACHPAISF